MEIELTDRILGEAVDELYAARDRGEDMHAAGHSVARRVAPLAVAAGLRQLVIGLHPQAGFVTVGALADLAQELEGH